MGFLASLGGWWGGFIYLWDGTWRESMWRNEVVGELGRGWEGRWRFGVEHGKWK